ncbi:MAG: hypothetical protein AB7E95_14720, partial [Kiritimatiellales bacterium]
QGTEEILRQVFMRKLRVRRKRHFHAYHQLIAAARIALKDAEEKRPGCYYYQMMAITLAGAKRAVSNIELIKDILCDRLPIDHHNVDLLIESWSGSSTSLKD